MAATVSIAMVNPGYARAQQATWFTLTITNSSTSSATVTSLWVSEATESDAVISQPNFLTPNVPVGTGNPTIAGSGTLSYPFSVIFTNPVNPGPTVTNPGGAAPDPKAFTPDPIYTLTVSGQLSDGSGFSSSLQVPVLSTVAPLPVQGGALQFAQGGNLMSLALMGAL